MIWELIFATIRISTPLVLVALGGLLTFQAGILNIALDGFMLIGAFVGIWVTYLTGSLTVGIAAAAFAGLLAALLFGLFNLKLKANIFIAGIAMNLLASGLTALLLKGVLKQDGVFTSSRIPTFPRLDLPLLSSIPVLRDTVSGHTLLVYVAFALVPVVSFFLYRTKWGLRVRSVGEAEEAALTEQDLLHLGRVGQHGDDHVRPVRRLRDAASRDRALGGDLVDRLPPGVMGLDAVARSDEVARHLAPHNTEPDETDRRHRRS